MQSKLGRIQHGIHKLYLFCSLFLFNTISYYNVHGFPSKPLHYSFKTAFFPWATQEKIHFLSGHTPQAELIFKHRTWSYPVIPQLKWLQHSLLSIQTGSSSEADPLHPMTVSSTCFVSQGLASAAVFCGLCDCDGLGHQLADWCDTHGTQFPEPSSVHSGCSKNMKMQWSSEVQTHQKEQNTKKPQANPISSYYSQSSFSTLDPSARVRGSKKCFCNRSNQTFLPAGCSWTSHEQSLLPRVGIFLYIWLTSPRRHLRSVF